MDTIVTKDTPQKLVIKSVVVTYDQYTNGELVNENHPVELTLTDELKTTIKPLLVEDGYNVVLE